MIMVRSVILASAVRAGPGEGRRSRGRHRQPQQQRPAGTGAECQLPPLRFSDETIPPMPGDGGVLYAAGGLSDRHEVVNVGAFQAVVAAVVLE